MDGIDNAHENAAVMTFFIAWFVIDGLLLANTDILFLKARQMLCFPTGMPIAKYKEPIKAKMNAKPVRLLQFGGKGFSYQLS